MQTVIQISLSGHSAMFQLDEDAYNTLRSYLDRARVRLKRDPDRDEVLCDLEQSIGDKLTLLLRSENRIVNRGEVDSVLTQVGAVDTGGDAKVESQFDRPRRLCRIEEVQWIAGVCQGLAAYSSISVEWARTIFLVAAIPTGGAIALLYLVLMFALPIVRTHGEYTAGLRTQSGST
jgi:phage shock protein PspC (stress-responsive transcriptional regulator)